MQITLVGSSGFLGRHLVAALAGAGHACTVLTRKPWLRTDILEIPGARLVQADVYDSGVLTRQFKGADAVVSMAGILNEKRRDGSGFREVHVTLVEGIVAAAQSAGVGRILHVSALNAGQGESHYLRSKGEGEAVLRDSGADVSIFRPSVIFGSGDSFFNRFAGLLSISPMLPLACHQAKMQPVYAGDVAAAMATVLEAPARGVEVFELGGPHVYSLGDLVRWTGRVSGHERRVTGLSDGLSRLQARLLDFVPGKPFSTDNYLSLQLDNVTRDNALPKLGIRPVSIEAVVPSYLGQSNRQRRLDDCRREPPRP
jgi:NADH dehydrogenase